MTRIWWVVALAACGGARSGEAPNGGRAAPPIALHACHVPHVTEELLCGTLDVPEDRAHPEGRHLVLPVIVLPAHAGRGHGVPLFSVQGGPGIPATMGAPIFATELAGFRDAGDIVLVDQRGTGDGPSALRCPELDDAPPNVPYSAEAVRACRDRLARTADLRFYGTAEVARDLDDARAALGYDRINLEAISYGTRVAQTYMREYPAHVHAVVLMGTLALDVRVPGEVAERAQHVLEAIVDDCAHDPACAAAYPHLRDQLATLATGPLPPGIDREAFTEWVRHLIYDAAGARRLPLVISHAATGDFTLFQRSAGAPHPPLREAVLLSVECSEDLPAIDRSEAARHAARASWFGDLRVEREAAACAEWPHTTLPRHDEPVASDAPVLVFAGGHDPITPPEYAKRATQHMPHATIVEIPEGGHLPDGLSHLECLAQIETAFLRDPPARLDTSCVAAVTPPPFAIDPR